jgi:hypothetical protein
VDIAGDLIALDLAVATAGEAGLGAEELVAAARTGALDTVQIDGLAYLRRSELGTWLRFRVAGDDTSATETGSYGDGDGAAGALGLLAEAQGWRPVGRSTLV